MDVTTFVSTCRHFAVSLTRSARDPDGPVGRPAGPSVLPWGRLQTRRRTRGGALSETAHGLPMQRVHRRVGEAARIAPIRTDGAAADDCTKTWR